MLFSSQIWSQGPTSRQLLESSIFHCLVADEIRMAEKADINDFSILFLIPAIFSILPWPSFICVEGGRSIFEIPE